MLNWNPQPSTEEKGKLRRVGSHLMSLFSRGMPLCVQPLVWWGVLTEAGQWETRSHTGFRMSLGQQQAHAQGTETETCTAFSDTHQHAKAGQWEAAAHS